ncbi:MAG: hypothetical protein ABW019_17800 [Chitinophagaceae bacterium]
MYKRTVILLFLVLGYCCVDAQQQPAAVLAEHIARKMKDTLQLSDAQKSSLYEINMQLHDRKKSARQQYAGSDSLRHHLQRIENSRDSLYRTILSQANYQLYLEKKKNLISAN